jgi:hypothetical protein
LHFEEGVENSLEGGAIGQEFDGLVSDIEKGDANDALFGEASQAQLQLLVGDYASNAGQ